MVLIIFAIPQIGCASDRPEPPGERLPFGVFPLNDVKGVHIGYFEDCKPDADKIIIEHRYDTFTDFVRQVGEKQADLYSTRLKHKINKIGKICANQ